MNSTEYEVEDAIWRNFGWDCSCFEDGEWSDICVLAEHIAELKKMPIREAGLMAFAYDMLAHYEDRGIDTSVEKDYPSEASLMEWTV